VNQEYKIPDDIWSQLRGLTSKELKRALDKDPGWELVKIDGSAHYYYNPNKCPSCQIVSIHVHPKKGGYGSKMLQGILKSIKWTRDEMIKLKLIKK